MSRGRRRLAATGIVLLALGTTYAGATTKKDGGVVDDETRTFTAKCPKGERVEVGGFKSTVNNPSGILLEDMTFKGGGRKWKATFDGFGDPAPATAYAYCADTPRLDTRKDSTTTPLMRARGGGGGLPVVAKAKCKGGSTVQLGGFQVRDAAAARGGPEHRFRAISMKVASGGDAWKVKGLANGGGVKLTAVAGCADLPAPKAVKKKAPVEGDVSQSSARAKCAKGEKVLLGGFKLPLIGGDPPYIRGMKLAGSRTLKTTVWEFGPSKASLTSIAYCG